MDNPTPMQINNNRDNLLANIEDLPMPQIFPIKIQKLIEIHLNKLNIVGLSIFFKEIIIKQILLPSIFANVLENINFMIESVL